MSRTNVRMRTAPWAPEELALIERQRQSWLAAGLATGPCDVPAVQAAWHALYRRAGRAPVFVWVVPGPLAAHAAIACWQRGSLGASLYDSLRDSLSASLSDSLNDSLRASLGDSLYDSLGASLGASLSGSLGDSLRGSLNDSLRGSLNDSLRASLGDSLYDSLAGSLRDSLRASLRASLDDSLRGSLGASLRTSLSDSLSGILGASLGASLCDSLNDSLGASLCHSLNDSLRASLSASLRASLNDSLGASLCDSLNDSLYDSLYNSLNDILRASLGANALTYEPTWFWGALEAWWIGWYRTAQQLGVAFSAHDLARLAEYEAAVMTTGWAWPFEGGVIVSERPAILAMEEAASGRWRLHGAGGPALAFRDGYEVYAWHGVRVDRSVIMDDPATWTLADILAEANAEVRRVKLERFGGERVRAHSRIRQQDDFGVLRELDVPGDGTPYVFVDVENSTPEEDGSFKRYCLAVPPDTQTCHEGVAWTFGLTPQEYALAAQT